MNTFSSWSTALHLIEKQHPYLTRLRVGSAASFRPDSPLLEELPAFLKVTIGVASRVYEKESPKPLRLVMIAPRWSEGAFWTAVGSALSAMKTNYEHAHAEIPDFSEGQKLLLDKSKVVEFIGESSKGIRLRDREGTLTVPSSFRLRLQPTTTNKKLSLVPFAGNANPDLLDKVLGIDCQGARHMFSTSVALVSAVTLAMNRADEVYVGLDTKNELIPINIGERTQILYQIRHIQRRLLNSAYFTGREEALASFQRAEEIATLEKMSPVEQEELVDLLRKKLLVFQGNGGRREEERIVKEMLNIIHPRTDNVPDALRVLNLFQWGSLSRDANLDIRSTGQIEANPVLLVCPDLYSLRQFLRGTASKFSKIKDNSLAPPLVILDGSTCFRNNLDILNGILDSNAPVIACLDRSEEEAGSQLVKRGFEVWRWTPDDLAGLTPLPVPANIKTTKSVFGDWQIALHNFSHHRLQVHVCTNLDIDATANRLIELLGDINPDLAESKALENAFYKSLLYISRLLHRPEGETELWLDQLLRHANDELTNCHLWLTQEILDRAAKVLQNIAGISRDKGFEGKMNEMLYVVNASTSPSIAVVLADAREITITSRQWERLLQKNQMQVIKRVSFCYPATVEEHLKTTKAEQLIICGWLGAKQMRTLLDGCLATDITMLLYPFERGWLRGALRSWQGKKHLNASQKLKLMGLSHSSIKIDLQESSDDPLTTLQMDMSEAEQKASEFEVGRFETRLRLHRHASMASVGQANDEKEEARLMEFSGDYFAFLSASCRLPVVNHLMLNVDVKDKTVSIPKMELPQKRSDELKTGDYVVFRQGAAGDLIRDMADAALRQTGLIHTREISGLWKVALHQWFEIEREHAKRTGGVRGDSAIIRKLQNAGIDRGELTIRHWLEQDRTIGPRDPETTLKVLARATGNEELKRRHNEVVLAISTVHSAHLKASEYLAQSLLARLPSYLTKRVTTDSFIEGAMEIEIKDVGAAVVVRVDEISDDLIFVSRSQINTLQHESKENQSTTTEDR